MRRNRDKIVAAGRWNIVVHQKAAIPGRTCLAWKLDPFGQFACHLPSHDEGTGHAVGQETPNGVAVVASNRSGVG